MATIADLIRLLDQQARDLGVRQPHDTPDAHAAAWTILAKATMRAVSNLPLGGRRGTIDAGIAKALNPLIDFRWKPLGPEITPAPALTGIARTIGAVADVLADTTRFDPRPALVGLEATRLQASILAGLHVTARWSRSVLQDQNPTLSRQALVRVLKDLAVVTEPHPLIPPAERASLLGDLRLGSVNAPGLEGAVRTWANEGRLVLQERYRVSGWAMQAIAGNLAQLSQLAARTVHAAAADGRMPSEPADLVIASLAESARSWRAAAAWPPILRLGGKVQGLREAVCDLSDACNAGPTPNLGGLRHVLTVAATIGALHAHVMEHLVTHHELWVDAESLGPAAGSATGWIREPWWSDEGHPIMDAARSAGASVSHAVHLLDRASSGLRTSARDWPREPIEPMARPVHEHSMSASPPMHDRGRPR